MIGKMIPRFVSETAEQLSRENPVNVVVVLIYFVAITVVCMWVIKKLRL